MRTKRKSRRRKSTTVVIAGMHRSGTSLVASMLDRAGVQLGDRLLPSDSGNPRGYYEDLDFFEFHSRALATRNQETEIAEEFVFVPTEDERRQAEKLLSARRAKGGVWGWKDPRTALFLDFWDELIPDARFVFVYRHPLDVVLSLARRGDVNYIGLVEGIDAWMTHNSRLLEFCHSRRDRCLLCHIRGVTEDVEKFGVLLRQRLGVEMSIDPTRLRELYRPGELRHAAGSRAVAATFSSLHPAAARLYRKLDAEADLAWKFEDAESSEPPDARLDWLKGTGASAEDAQAHRRGLTFALVAFLEPEALEKLFQEFVRYRRDREHGLAWLAGQVRALEDQVARGNEAIDMFRLGVEELEHGKDWLCQQKARLEAELSRSHEQYEQLRVSTEELTGGRDWLLEQRSVLEAELARSREQYEELLKWTRELERGRDWLLEQKSTLESALGRSRAQNEELRRWAEELERGRDWLLEQRSVRDTELTRLRDRLAELLDWTGELTKGRSWLLDQKSALESALDRCNEQNESLRRWAEELQRGRDWLFDQKSRLEEEVAKWARHYDELRAWVEERDRGRE